MNIQTITYWAMGITVAGAVAVGALLFFLSPARQNQVTTTTGNGFGVGDTRTLTVTPSGSSEGENTNTPITTPTQNNQKIFKLVDGPVTTATLVQTYHPTTTIARYVLQENGHVMDLVLDQAGGVPRAVSNTTIPGTARGIWSESGAGVILQYLDSTIVKTVHVAFPTTTSTSTGSQPVRIQFFPDNIIDFGVSADGKNVTYLLKTSTGSDGYTAQANGASSKKVFSTPFSQLLVSWPAASTILLQTKRVASAEGAAFSVNAQNGVVTPLVYANGLTAIADKTFSRIVYQNSFGDVTTYVHDMKTGKDKELSFNPIPEKCVWSGVSQIILYCASPLEYVPANYLDMWHQGSASVPDAIFAYNVVTGQSTIVVAPGGGEGGVASDITELAVSPDDHYLLFVKKGDRSLWGVRLTQ